MKVQTTNVMVLVLVILRDVCQGTILCSQCHLKDNPDCEEKPPGAQPCFDPGDGIPQTCSVIRTYDAENVRTNHIKLQPDPDWSIMYLLAGEQVDFRRSCSNSKRSGCFDDPKTGYKICAKICKTDYCNGPSSSSHFFFNPWLLSCAALMGLFVPKSA